MVSQQMILYMTDVNVICFFTSFDVMADVNAKDVIAVMPCDRCYSHFY